MTVARPRAASRSAVVVITPWWSASQRWAAGVRSGMDPPVGAAGAEDVGSADRTAGVRARRRPECLLRGLPAAGTRSAGNTRMGARVAAGVGHDRRRGWVVRAGRRRRGPARRPVDRPAPAARPCAAGVVRRWRSPAVRRRRRCSPPSPRWTSVGRHRHLAGRRASGTRRRPRPQRRSAGRRPRPPPPDAGHRADLARRGAPLRRAPSRSASTSCTSAWAPTGTPHRGRRAIR